MGSSIFSQGASTSVRTRGVFEMLPVSCHCVVLFLVPGSLTRLCWVQHVTASISSRGKLATATQCLVKDIAPASGGIIHAVWRFLQSCSNVRRMSCFWWQLTHNITVHIRGLSLKKSCFEIKVEKIPSLACCHLATHAKSGSCGCRRNQSVSIPSAYPGNLSIPIWLWPSGSYLACPSCWWAPIVRSHSFSNWTSSCRWDQKLRCQPRICAQDVLLQHTVCSILLLLGLMLPFVHEISFWLLFLLPFRR